MNSKRQESDKKSESISFEEGQKINALIRHMGANIEEKSPSKKWIRKDLCRVTYSRLFPLSAYYEKNQLIKLAVFGKILHVLQKKKVAQNRYENRTAFKGRKRQR